MTIWTIMNCEERCSVYIKIIRSYESSYHGKASGLATPFTQFLNTATNHPKNGSCTILGSCPYLKTDISKTEASILKLCEQIYYIPKSSHTSLMRTLPYIMKPISIAPRHFVCHIIHSKWNNAHSVTSRPACGIGENRIQCKVSILRSMEDLKER